MIPGLWAIVDNSPSTTLSVLLFAAHIFRMSLFFFVAGFFARMLFQRQRRARLLARIARSASCVPLVAGWLVVCPVDRRGVDLGPDEDLRRHAAAAAADLPPPPPGAFPLTHLWFLYYLLVLYAVVLLGRALVVALDRPASSGARRIARSRGLVRSGAAALVLCRCR